VRLLLDEHYSKQIAQQLRDRGHDVVAVTERPDLAGLRDDQLLDAMAAEGRAIVTENWSDFHRLIRQATASGAAHHGVVFTSRRQLPRSRAAIGLHVGVLDDFLQRHPDDDALRNAHHWLPDRPLA
jgi:hypothetical protein